MIEFYKGFSLFAIQTQEDFSVNCDVCSYTKSIKLNETKNYLNVPCPDCGSNLLTEKDLKKHFLLLRIMKVVNILFVPYMIVAWHLSSKHRDICRNNNQKFRVWFVDGEQKIEKVEEDE